MATYTKLNNWN